MTRHRSITLPCGVALIASILATPAMCQDDPTPGGRPFIAKVSHWGRWATLLGAGAFIAVAATNSSSAGLAFDDLETICTDDPAACELVETPDGNVTYADPLAEQTFQDYAQYQSRAQSFLVAGQLTLVVSGGMFLLDLLYKDDEPKNIPYTPFEVYSTPRELGLSLRF
jgi:hypothetical protein